MSTPSSRHQETSYRDRTFTGPQLDRIAFPLGGIGAGMICMEGTGAFSHVSIHHAPDVSREAAMFGALWVKGEPGTAGAAAFAANDLDSGNNRNAAIRSGVEATRWDLYALGRAGGNLAPYAQRFGRGFSLGAMTVSGVRCYGELR